MNLKNYFDNTNGRGILSTVDNNGVVNSAIYSRPHILDDGTIAFIMTNRRSYSNIQSNPYASYLFIEESEKLKGKRLALKKTREYEDPDIIQPLRRRRYSADMEKNMKPLHLVCFELEKELPLVGDSVNS